MTDHSEISALLSLARQADLDPTETREWIDALSEVVAREGEGRARFLLQRLTEAARGMGVDAPRGLTTPYRNTIPLEKQAPFPGDLSLENRLTAIVRWNALAMVVRANRVSAELGGHIASYASAADLFEVGFNHFFRGNDAPCGADLVFFQPHSAPGVYARAFLEGRLSEAQLSNYRREMGGGGGLSSYPHPWLMPDFWQFPTGSMGLGPIQAIYQARFMRYLEHRGIAAPGERKVWAFVGDGEMDEPESLAALSLAAREGLDNLVFVVNCNLQRLDGPVRGNGSIIQELEGLFAGAGWNVIKLLWGSNWDALFARDHAGALLQRLHETVDGEFQKYSATDGRFNREHFFNKYPEVRALIAHMSDADIDQLKRGGHDPVKIHAAYHAAAGHRGTPTVILAKTMKGFGMGSAGQAKMTTHQQKKLDDEALLAFRDRFALPLSDDEVRAVAFYRPAPDSAEMKYLAARRSALGGALPMRRGGKGGLPVPQATSFARFAFEPAPASDMSSTMAFVRMLTGLTRDKGLGRNVVPIVADEARTFGMQAMFRGIGIYSPTGQAYEPEDADELLFYKEARDGQILEEGITEAGALSSWIAAATSYANHGVPMLPFYIYYSMFGFQRVADLIWAAADQRSRGFLVGATSGRTTLAGEGLQHQDGSSHLVASTVPNCRAYDPCHAYEVAVILEEGMRAMLERGEDVFYYLTVMNENAAQAGFEPDMREGIVRGMYRLCAPAGTAQVRLLGSGAILTEVVAAAAMLRADFGIEAEVFSVTSYSELQRDGMAAEREQLRAMTGGAGAARRTTWVQKCLGTSTAPVIAASDYVRALPELIRLQVTARYATLGTDGFGRSDTRAALRRFFEVDRFQVVMRALMALAENATIDPGKVAEAAARYGVTPAAAAPWTV